MRGRVRRGFLKSYILKLLSEGEKSGYDLIQTISQETGFWKPSAGSMYPLLQSLEEAKLIDFRTEDRRKVYYLTDRGRLALDEVTDAREQMRRSIDQSSQVFERVFGPDSLDSVRGSHRLGDHVPRDIRKRFYELHRTLHQVKTIDSQVQQDVASLLDQIIALLREKNQH